jgi:hypothetical protein
MKSQRRPLFFSSTLPCLLALLIPGAADAQTLSRGSNVLGCYGTFSCSGSTGWTLSGATVDNSASPVSGNSIKLTSAGSYLESNTIWSVTPDTTYTFSVYMKADNNLPQARPTLIVGLYKDNTSWTFSRNVVIKSQSVNQLAGGWQEVVVSFQPKATELYAGLRIEMTAQATEATTPSTFWVSEAYLGSGIGFAEPAATKSEFIGSLVKVHSRGEFEIKQGANWTQFFPICIYADPARTSWSTYKSLGFNCNMRAGDGDLVRRGKTAGLYSGLEISTYIYPKPGSTIYNNISLLEDIIDDLAVGTDVRDSILFYYWDNEALGEWSVPAAVAATIDERDRDANGDRMHPVYSLQGQEGLARKYNPDGLVSGTKDINDVVQSMSDTVGTYVSQEAHNGSTTYTQTFDQTILQNIEQQKQPVSVAIFNGNPNGGKYAGIHFRAAAYTAIAHGATGIAYWRDCVSSCTGFDSAPQLESTAWWTDLPALAAKIQSQVPMILSAPPGSAWLSKTSTTDNVQWGLRDYQSKGYLIAGNENSAAATPSFSISGLGYTPTSVIDAYARDWMTDISSGTFSLPLEANDGGFYLLGSKVPDTLALKLEFTGNLNDASVAGNSGGVLSSSGAAISSNALAVSGGDVKIPAHPSLEMNGDLTIVARVNISSSQTGYAAIAAKGALTANMAGYLFFYDPATSQLRFWYGKGGSGSGDRNTLNATVPSLLGGWHTVAVTAKLNGTVTLYVDGQDYAGSGTVNTEYRNTMANPDEPLQIGAAGWGNYLNGSIDDLRIFKAALTKSEINAL